MILYISLSKYVQNCLKKHVRFACLRHYGLVSENHYVYDIKCFRNVEIRSLHIKQKKSELKSSLQFYSNNLASKHIINSLIKQAPIKVITKAILTEFVQQIGMVSAKLTSS